MAAIKFKQIDHPSDVSIIAYGNNHQEVFENAAYGMFSLMANLTKVAPKSSLTINVTADEPEALLVNWLNELIYHEDAKKMLFSKFEITKLTNTELAASVWGEKINVGKHTFARPIKAVTFSQLHLDANQAKIIFDV